MVSDLGINSSWRVLYLAARAGLHVPLREPVLAVEAGGVAFPPLHAELPPQQAGGWGAVLGLQGPPGFVIIAVAGLHSIH